MFDYSVDQGRTDRSTKTSADRRMAAIVDEEEEASRIPQNTQTKTSWAVYFRCIKYLFKCPGSGKGKGTFYLTPRRGFKYSIDSKF